MTFYALPVLGLYEPEPLVAMFGGFFDESGKHHCDRVVTLASVCAPCKRIRDFDDAWDYLLRKYNIKEFHMVEAIRPTKPLGKIPSQTMPERVEALKPFIDCINKHMEFGTLQAWEVAGFKGWGEITNMKFGNLDNPYYLTFVRGLAHIMEQLRHDDKIHLVIDDDRETSHGCLVIYQTARARIKAIEKKTVSITFAKDRYFAGLQAADMVARLVKTEAEYRFFGERYDYRDLWNYLTSTRALPTCQWWDGFADKKVLGRIDEAFGGKTSEV